MGEIKFNCSCPDWATMCKHVAAVLYGVGSRLDNRPELLFLLRGVDAEELISAEISLPAVAAGEDGAIADDQLGGIFGIDLDVGEASPTKSTAKTTQASRQMRKSTPRKKQEPAAEKGRKTSAVNRRAEKTPVIKPSEAAAPSMEAPTRFRPTGQSVAMLRKQLGLSVEQFAKRIGVTAASIYRWGKSFSGRTEVAGPPAGRPGKAPTKGREEAEIVGIVFRCLKCAAARRLIRKWVGDFRQTLLVLFHCPSIAQAVRIWRSLSSQPRLPGRPISGHRKAAVCIVRVEAPRRRLP